MSDGDDRQEVADIGLRALVRDLQELPEEVRPPRSLWPEIEARISKIPQELPPRAWLQRWIPLAMAASLLIALSALGLSVFTYLNPPEAVPPLVQVDPRNAIEEGFAPARLAYLRDLAQRDTGLDAETRAVLRENLRIIEDATREIQEALTQHPGDPLLLDALELIARNELDILEELAAPRIHMI